MSRIRSDPSDPSSPGDFFLQTYARLPLSSLVHVNAFAPFITARYGP